MANDSTPNVAIFCDYENVAIGARDARFEFDIHLVLERVLDKGKVVVKKAYADWDRYKSAKRALHEASFELIEIPHVSYSGKNSADIRLVVDALDLCHTKAHVDAFVIVSGDSDFSPLVSKLRENDKTVIGLGVKNSSSDLLIDNCDEFIYYDDLVRSREKASKKKGRAAQPKPRKKAEPKAAAASEERKTGDRAEAPEERKGGEKAEAPEERKTGDKQEALEAVLDTVESLFQDRGGDELWGSMVKQTLKRKQPRFSESYYGYRTFGELLEHAAEQGLLDIQKDDKSGNYVIRGFGPAA